jgi:hypothetical protein
VKWLKALWAKDFSGEQNLGKLLIIFSNRASAFTPTKASDEESGQSTATNPPMLVGSG